MCIQTKVQRLQAQKEALDAQIAKLEKLEAATAPAKNLLAELLTDYAQEAPEDLTAVWEEILAIGQQHGLSVQPLVADELREWEADRAELETFRQQSKICSEYEQITGEDASALSAIECQRQIGLWYEGGLTWNYPEHANNEIKKLQTECEQVKREYLALIEATATDAIEIKKLRSQLIQIQSDKSEVWHKEDITPGLENLYQETLIETDSEATAELSDKEYDAAVEAELALDDDEKDIPALTLWQPWATLIQQEVKRVETRSWATNYRGPIAIHAAKRPVNTADSTYFHDLLLDNCEFPLEAVVAIVNLIDCVEMTPEFIAQQSEQEIKCGDWQPGRFAWVLEIIRPMVPPIQVSGGQKLWNWSGTSIAAELEYLEKSKATLEPDSKMLVWKRAGDGTTAIYKEVSAASLEPEYEPKEASDTVESVLEAKGFFQPNDLEDYDSSEKYETYRGWDIYYSLPNGGIVSIGLYNAKYNQPWDANTEYIQEVDSTFPESLADFDEIVKWTRALIDQAENLEVPGLLSLEFPNPTATPEQTKLQKLIEGNSNFTFEELGVSVEIQSVFTEEEIESEDEDEDESDGPATEKVEEALITTCNTEGRHWEYWVSAQTFIYQYTIESIEQAALGYAQHFLRDLKKEAKAKEKITQWNADDAQQSEPAKLNTETEFEMMGLKVRVHPQLPMGVTFRFLNPDNTLAFSNSLISAEIGDRTWKVCASDLIENYRKTEAARIDKEANPYKKPEDGFVEFVKLSNAVGYLKRRDNGQLIAGYAAFSNKLPDGHRAGTQAKSRAAKWAEWLKGTFELECDAPRIAKRVTSENSKQPFAYEVKFKGLSIGQLTKLAEEDFSLLPGEVEEQQQNTELLRSEVKTLPDGLTLTDEQYSELVDDDSTPMPIVKSTFTGLTLSPECGLNEDEVELVEMARAAIVECDSEMAKSVNLVFKEVCQKNAANRVKVWNSLTEKEQQTYKLLLQMEFAKAPDFAEQTPEYIAYLDGKIIANVWISLRTVDGKASRMWRYTNQGDEIGYPTKESAVIAVIQQKAE